MTINRVQGPNSTKTTNVSAFSVTMSMAPTNNNILIACIGLRTMGSGVHVSSVQQSSGNVAWQQIVSQVDSSGDTDTEIWAGTVSSGASQTVNISLSGNNQQEAIADICEYNGLQGTTPDLTKGNPGTTSNNTYVGTTSVTAQDYELWIGAISFYSNNYDQQIPTNGTLLDGALFNSLSLGYIEIIATVIGTPNCGTQNQGPGVWGGCIAAFKGTGSFAADSPNGLLEIEDVLRIDAPQIYDDPSQDQYITLGVIPGMQGSILQLNASLLTRSDVMVYGSIGSQTDPAKLAIGEGGGGALLIGHGWLGGGSPLALSPPLIELMDSEIQIQSGQGFPSGMTSQDAGALFNRTDQGILYIYSGTPNIGINGWVVSESTNFSGYYDTLFLVMNNSYTPANLDLGNLTCHSVVEPGSDNTSSIGTSTNMFQNMYTRSLIIGNNSASGQPKYLTFSIDSGGSQLNITSASGGCTIAPDPTKTTNLGCSTNPWTSICCLGLNFMNSGLTANSGLSYWTCAQVGEFMPSHGIASSGDLYTPTNLWCAGSIIFNPSSGANAYLIWVNSGVLGLLSDTNVGVGSYTNNSHSYYLGALDAGAVYTNYLQPLNNASAPNNYITVGGTLIPALSALESSPNNTCNIGSTNNPWYWGYFNNLTINNLLYDSAGHGGSSYSGYFLSLNSSGYPVWVPSSATWNGGTVTNPIYLNISPSTNAVLKFGSLGSIIDSSDSTNPLFYVYNANAEWSYINGSYPISVFRMDNTGAFNWYTSNVAGSPTFTNTMSLDSSGDLTLAGNLSGSGFSFSSANLSCGNLSCGTLGCGTVTSTGNLYLSNNTNGYLWNNGGYIRQSGGNGFVADGSITGGQLPHGTSTSSPVPVYATYQGTLTLTASSQRYKENVVALKDCSWLYDLCPVSFDWKAQERKCEGRQIGLIAEEVHALCPQLTWLDDKGQPEGVHYEKLGVPLVVELQKLKQRITTLENQLKQNTAAA